jgi:6-pyruvoyltetrahydropterin/6-carboxytetrahydropterin synthase
MYPSLPVDGLLTLERRYRFSASHLYRRPAWSEEENRRRFGACSNLPGHGHNYRLWVGVTGAVDPETGYLADLGELDRWVGEEVLRHVDHQHLNHALEDFRAGAAVPTTENVLLWIRRRLADTRPEKFELRFLRLEEDEDLAAAWRSTT